MMYQEKINQKQMYIEVQFSFAIDFGMDQVPARGRKITRLSEAISHYILLSLIPIVLLAT